MERNRYFETIEDLLRRLEITQKENIHHIGLYPIVPKFYIKM